MEVQRFEQAILKLAFETDAKITTASVAYYLGIPSREANRLLNELLEEGVLELDSDEEGNLYYRVPNKGVVATAKPNPEPGAATRELAAALSQDLDSHPDTAVPGRAEPIAPGFVSIDDDEAPAFSPSQMPAAGPDGATRRPRPEPSGPYTRPFGQDGEFRRPHSPIVDASNYRFGPGQTERRPDRWQERSWNPAATTTRHAPYPDSDDLFYGTTARVAAPDATVNRCGQSPVVVAAEVRCEPKPLPETRPVVVSCTGYDSSQSALAQSDFGFGYATPRASTALATTGDFALTADSHIEQPEHQPGMALLLSLILCGTGQIYNGEVSKGIIMMVLCFLLWFVLLGWVVHIWSIVDAVVVAERINRKHH
jgi:predicted transcriptional regulator